MLDPNDIIIIKKLENITVSPILIIYLRTKYILATSYIFWVFIENNVKTAKQKFNIPKPIKPSKFIPNLFASAIYCNIFSGSMDIKVAAMLPIYIPQKNMSFNSTATDPLRESTEKKQHKIKCTSGF